MKRKTTNLVIVLLSFLTAALIALAVFMPWFTKEQTAFLEKSLRDAKNEHSVQDSSDTADTSDHIVSSSCHHFLFVGDSRTVGLSEYGDLGNADVFADSGMSVFNLLDSKPKKGAGSDKTLNQLLEEKNYKAVFLMLGINELGYGNQNILKQYRTVVSYIKEKQPEAALILEANLHVTKTKSDRSPIYNNENINALNQGIKQIAAEENCPYIDVNVIFDDESGNLNETYTTDGSHVLGKYYALWTEWIFD